MLVINQGKVLKMKVKIGDVYIAEIKRVENYIYNRFDRVTHSFILPKKFVLINKKDKYFITPYGVKVYNKSYDTNAPGDLFISHRSPLSFIDKEVPSKVSKKWLRKLQEHLDKNNNQYTV